MISPGGASCSFGYKGKLDLFMTVEFETTRCRTTPGKPAMPLVPMYGKTVRLNAPEIRSMDETHVHKDPSGPLDREKTKKTILKRWVEKSKTF
jgi:hypothetical protein